MSKGMLIPDEPEIWKDIPGYEGFFQISSWGKVRSVDRLIKRPGHANGDAFFRGKLMAIHLNEKGYRRVVLSKQTERRKYRVCRLVAIVFVPNPDSLPEINHDDLDKQNDYYKNLSWSTHGDNVRHAFANRTIRRYKNEENPDSKKVGQYNKGTGDLIKEWPSINELKRQGFNYAGICVMCNGGYVGTHVNGFIWKYI